ADVVLVFANERSVRNIEDGKFTLGSDVATVSGPVGRHTTTALTGRAEVYAYIRSRGLFAGAVFEGARLDVDEQGTARFYAARGGRGAGFRKAPGAPSTSGARRASTPRAARMRSKPRRTRRRRPRGVFSRRSSARRHRRDRRARRRATRAPRRWNRRKKPERF